MPREFFVVMRCVVVSAVIFMVTRESLAEPVVKETREGDTSVIRITSADGAEKVYRIDLSQRHVSCF